VAEALGLRVAGVLGLLVLSKRRGLMPAVRLALEDFEVSTPTPPQRTLTWWSAS
jgi:predicted nucleic acid-binding protein